MAFSMLPIYSQKINTAAGVGYLQFTNIPQNFKELVIEISGRTNATDTGNFTQVVLYVNSEPYPATSHSFTQLEGNGSSAYSGRESGTFIRLGYFTSANATSGSFANIRARIPNYTSSNFKPVISESVTENNATGAESVKTSMIAGLYRGTAPVTSLVIDCGRLQSQNTTVTIYGMKQG